VRCLFRTFSSVTVLVCLHFSGSAVGSEVHMDTGTGASTPWSWYECLCTKKISGHLQKKFKTCSK